MKTTQTTAGILDLRASGYGAVEIKKQTRMNTIRGFAITSSTIALFFFLYWGLAGKETIRTPEISKKVMTIEITDILPPPPTLAPTGILPEPVIPKGVGLSEVGGNFVAVDDDLIPDDAPEIATVDKIGRVSAHGTPDGIDDGVSIDRNAIRTPATTDIKIQKQVDAFPDEEIFIPVEKEPAIDLAKLQSLITYPDLARKAGVQGTVLLHVLVGADGAVKSVVVKESESMLLDDAAKKAIAAYGTISPALQNGQTIACWVYVPIKFRLR